MKQYLLKLPQITLLYSNMKRNRLSFSVNANGVTRKLCLILNALVKMCDIVMKSVLIKIKDSMNPTVKHNLTKN